jgi:hypothetical protein
MPMIFPGMDPWMEDPPLWPDVHESLIVYLRAQLQPRLRPRYVAAIERRLYVEGPDRNVAPDLWIRESRQPRIATGPVASGPLAMLEEIDEPLVANLETLEVHESYIEVRDLHSGHDVVAVIEVVSPSNKHSGPGRDSYLAKQREILASPAHLVEIDLLRGGQHVLAMPEWLARSRASYEYLVCMNRSAGKRERFEFYACRLRDRLPRIGVPLAGEDPDAPLDLQAGLARVYEDGAYDDQADYANPCHPPLSSEDQAWAAALIRGVGKK